MPSYKISIHAPLAGCDIVVWLSSSATAPFQSTHPLRGATLAVKLLTKDCFQFQSTHPLRCATAAFLAEGRMCLISIQRTPCGVRLAVYESWVQSQ